jgi:O-antigen ligase
MKLLFNLKNIVFVLLGLSIPTSVALTNILIVLFVFLWLIEGDFSRKLSKIKSVKWIWSLISLAILYILGLTYGDAHDDSIYVIQRVLLLLFFIPLITTEFKQSTYRYAVITFLMANLTSALVAIGINYEIINPIANGKTQISAFILYNYHNILLSFSSLLSFLLFTKSTSRYSYLYLMLIIVYSTSIFSEAGRAGQLTFNVFFILYTLYFLNKKILYSFSIICFLVLVNVYSYNNSAIYKYRVDNLTHTVQNDGMNKNPKVKQKNIRYMFHKESFKLIKNRPFLGYGTGSFASIFRNNTISSYMYYDHKTPHNNFLYVLFELGLIGLLTFLSMFYFQIKDLFSVRIFRYERLMLPLFLIFLMLFDSYLFIFTITLFYQFMFTIFRGIELDSKD